MMKAFLNNPWVCGGYTLAGFREDTLNEFGLGLRITFTVISELRRQLAFQGFIFFRRFRMGPQIISKTYLFIPFPVINMDVMGPAGPKGRHALNEIKRVL